MRRCLILLRRTSAKSLSTTSTMSMTATSHLPPPSHPHCITLPYSRRTLLVDPTIKSATAGSRRQRLDSAYSLVCDAVRRADNVGVGEYPTMDDVTELVDHSDVTLGLSCTTTPETLKCLIVVSPCRYARSVRPTLCTITVITDEDFSGRLLVRELVAVAVDAAAGLAPEAAYSACVVDVFVTCLDRVLALRDEGFLITACIPNAGRLTGVSGYTANYIMYKELTPGTRTGQPNVVISSSRQHYLLTTPGSADVSDVKLQTDGDFRPTMLPITDSKIPARVRMFDGAMINVRPMRRDELRPFYEALREAMNSGAGYGLDEIPNFEYFLRLYVHNFHNYVCELADGVGGGEVVAFLNNGRSPFARTTVETPITDGNIVMTPKFRGKRWFSDLATFINSMWEERTDGVIGHQGDSAATQLAALVGVLHNGYIANGVLPKGIYFQDKGWTDLVLYYVPYRSRSDPTTYTGSTMAKL